MGFELFFLGTLGFWALLALECIILITFVNYEKGGWATASLIGTVALVHFGSNLDVIASIAAHPYLTVGAIVAYFAIGTVWAIAKWKLFVDDLRAEYDEAKADFLEHKGVEGTVIPDELKRDWQRAAPHRTDSGKPPQARRHKSRILMWMSYWPWSVFWTFAHDFVVKVFNRIYNSISSLLQRISDNAFEGVADDFTITTPPSDDNSFSDSGSGSGLHTSA